MNNAWVSIGIAFTSLLVGVGVSRAENPEHVRQLMQTNSCKGCDLSYADLRGLNLRNANLETANLESADLSGTQLSRANLQNANLKKATVSNANFTGANLRDATLAGAKIFSLCQENSFPGFGSGEDQASTCLMLSLMSSVGPEELCKTEYSLQNLKMGESFCLTLGMKEFPSSSLLMTSFKSFLTFTSFYGADLTNTDFQSVDLSGADLRYANLSNLNLQDTKLDYANLINANLQNIPREQLQNALVKTSDVKNLIQIAIAKDEEKKRKKRGLMSMKTLLRAQQAFRLENNRFAKDIEDIDSLIKPQKDYTYAIVSQDDPTKSVVITALSKASDLKSYLGIAFQDKDSFSRLICETIEASKSIPSFDFSSNKDQCPSGTKTIESSQTRSLKSSS